MFSGTPVTAVVPKKSRKYPPGAEKSVCSMP